MSLLNRLLLSSLRVSVEKQSRDISLFTPITIPAQRSRGDLLEFKAKPKEYYLLPQDKAGAPYQFAFSESEVPQFAMENPQFATKSKLEMVKVKPVKNLTTDKRFPDGFEITVCMKGNTPQLPNSVGRLGLRQNTNSIDVALWLDACLSVKAKFDEANTQLTMLQTQQNTSRSQRDEAKKNKDKGKLNRLQQEIDQHALAIAAKQAELWRLDAELKSIQSLQNTSQLTFRLILKKPNSGESIVLLMVEDAGDEGE